VESEPVSSAVARRTEWHDSFICVTWLIHVCATSLMHMCGMIYSYVGYEAFIYVTRPSYIKNEPMSFAVAAGDTTHDTDMNETRATETRAYRESHSYLCRVIVRVSFISVSCHSYWDSSHVTHVNDSCRTHHVTDINIYICINIHISGIHICDLMCATWLMSYTDESHVHDSCHRWVTCEWLMSYTSHVLHMWMTHVIHIMSQIWMRLVTQIWI